MANIIQHKRSSTSGVAPVASGLSQGELAINIADGKLYTKNNANAVINLGVTSISGTYITPSSGNFFDYLAVNGVPVSVSGHSHTSVPQAQSLVTNVFNKTATTIPKFSVVYINGGQGDQPTIQLAIASGESGSSKTYGITAEAISSMSAGSVIVAGALSGVNTDQFNPTAPVGDVNGITLYLSPSVSGAATTTKPYAPNHLVSIGTIIRTHQNAGVIEVKIQNGFELQELHNVALNSTSDGQFLQYNYGSGLWVASSSGNFTSLTINNNTIVTGTGVANHVAYWNSSSGIVADSGQLVWDSINNRLGIGTSTPSGQLHVVGTGIFTGVDINNSAIAGQGALTVNGNIITQNNIIRGGTFSIYGDNNTRIYKADGSTLNYSVSSSGYKHSFGYDITGNHTSWMTINNTGIGIRTNSPVATLDVRGSAIFNEDGANADFRIEGDSDTHLVFVDASTDNVGIGYSTPTTKLQVNGTFSCGGGYGGDPSSGGQGLYINPASPLLRLIDSGPNYVADIDVNGLTLYDIVSNPFFYTDRANARIGIGTSSPNANFAISAGGAGGTIDGAAQSQPFQINDSTASDYINLAHFNITNSGSRGSFTLSNNSSGAWENNVMQFFIHGNAYGHGYYGGNSNDAGCAMIVTQGSQITKLQIGNIPSAPIEFFTGNAFRMKIDSDGDVGIGIASPIYKLDVNGTIGDSTNGYVVVQDLTISNSTAGTISIDSATNNLSIVGDGTITITSNVDQQVNINSNIDVNGDLTFNSYTEKVVAIGNSSTSQTIDLTSGTVQTCTLTGNCTFTMPTATAGKSFSLFLNTGTGGYSATFTGVRWSDSTPPTITSTASKVDLLSFISDGTYWYGSFSQNYG